MNAIYLFVQSVKNLLRLKGRVVAGIPEKIKISRFILLALHENTLQVSRANPRITFDNLERTTLFVSNLKFHIKYGIGSDRQ